MAVFVIWDILIIGVLLFYNWDLFYYHGLTLIPARVSNHMPNNVWDEITYPFLKFNSCTLKFGNISVIPFHTF